MPRAFAAPLALIFLLGACGAEQEDRPAAARPGTVLAVTTTGFGDTLVDGAGRSLYRFDHDAGGESSCYDACARQWPPLRADGELSARDGAEPALLGTVERRDGQRQVTYAGHPLYHFAADDGPGAVGGHGAGGVWWLMRADGSKVPEPVGGAY